MFSSCLRVLRTLACLRLSCDELVQGDPTSHLEKAGIGSTPTKGQRVNYGCMFGG